MTGRALVLVYHGVEAGPPPLFLEPALFRRHVECLVEAGATALTVGELARLLEAGRPLPERAVAITFDDAFGSVVDHAAPVLIEYGLPATVFAVAGYLGGRNDWPSQPSGVPRRPLAGAADLAELARAGFEIGSHGTAHLPLTSADAAVARRELVDSRQLLEDSLGVPVTSFAYPYGATPSVAALAIARSAYRCAGNVAFERVDHGHDLFALPRVDAHYLSRPALLRRAALGSLGPYLRVRKAGARLRRVFAPDHVGVPRTVDGDPAPSV